MKKGLYWVVGLSVLLVLGLAIASALSTLTSLRELGGSTPPPPPVAPVVAAQVPVEKPPVEPAVPVAPVPAPAVEAPAAPAPAAPAEAVWRPAPDADLWVNAKLLTRSDKLGVAGKELSKALHAADLQACFGEASQRYAGQTVIGAKSPDTHDTDAPELQLQVQYQGGVLRVGEAPVRARGGASDETLACMQAKLRNLEVKVSAPSKFDRFVLQYAPQPP